MKLIIAGSRCFTQYQDLLTGIALSPFNVPGLVTEVVSGTAHGTDTLGEDWARKNHIPVTPFPANWDLHGKRAGIFRNVTMANYADALLALWDEYSSGTYHMISTMRSKHKPYFVYDPWTGKHSGGNLDSLLKTIPR